MKQVAIYSTPTCTYCKAAKMLFAEHQIPYVEYDVSVDLARRQELIEKSGQLGVPVITIDDQVVVGFDERRLERLLLSDIDMGE
jgi:glutaredoxin-like YruB-family protein